MSDAERLHETWGHASLPTFRSSAKSALLNTVNASGFLPLLCLFLVISAAETRHAACLPAPPPPPPPPLSLSLSLSVHRLVVCKRIQLTFASIAILEDSDYFSSSFLSLSLFFFFFFFFTVSRLDFVQNHDLLSSYFFFSFFFFFLLLFILFS